MHEVRVGDQVVVGHDGIRVQPFERARDREAFAFMQSSVSSEKVKVLRTYHPHRDTQLSGSPHSLLRVAYNQCFQSWFLPPFRFSPLTVQRDDIYPR